MPSLMDYTHGNAPFFPAGYPCAFLFRRVYLGSVHPEMRARAIVLVRRCFDRGMHYYAEFGFRSWAHQHQLRLAFLNGTGGRAAPAGESAHNYGLAMDFTADADPATPGLQPTWDNKRYDMLGEEATRVGLAWGKAYGDRPHLNLIGFTSAADLRPLQSVWRNAPAVPDDQKLLACWQTVDVLRSQRVAAGLPV